MPLILAIEPDRRQAAQLASIAQGRIGAELVMAESAEKALRALGDRVPDLILTPPLLSPRDDAAITDRLRALGTAATYVQTLTIPALATAEPRTGGQGARPAVSAAAPEGSGTRAERLRAGRVCRTDRRLSRARPRGAQRTSCGGTGDADRDRGSGIGDRGSGIGDRQFRAGSLWPGALRSRHTDTPPLPEVWGQAEASRTDRTTSRSRYWSVRSSPSGLFT